LYIKYFTNFNFCIAESYNKPKRTLYFVLKRKGFVDVNTKYIDYGLEKRLIEYLKNISPKLNQMKFDNLENSPKCLLLKEMIKILDEI
jgi:hypothetical protein